MHRGRWAACAGAIALVLTAVRADSAGVYENAATESALLVSPQRISLRGTVEVGESPGLDAFLYRFVGAFPARAWCLLWLELPFVSVSDDDGIESGDGDLLVRARVRLANSGGRALSLLGAVGTGSGNRRFFPYSSQTVDIGTSIGFVDSIGALQPFAIVGYQWQNRVEESRFTRDTQPADHLRVSAGADFDLGPRTDLRGGLVFHAYDTEARRALLFAGSSFAWTPMFRLGAQGQFELGRRSQRVGDWSLTAGLTVLF